MVSSTLLLAAAAVAPLASAHFGLEYPAWRADTLQSDTNYSQWQYPCTPFLPFPLPHFQFPPPDETNFLLPGAGVPTDAGNRTDWPLTGGSLKLDLHHPWEYVFVNLGLGSNVTNFNYTLTGPTFWNVTGAGVLCVDLPLPEGLKPTDGQQASIQVVNVGASGSALYNVSFSSVPGYGDGMSGKRMIADENDPKKKNSAPISPSAPTPLRCPRTSARPMTRCRLLRSRSRVLTAPRAARARLTTKRVVLRSLD